MRSRLRAFIDYMRYVYGREWAYVVGLASSVLALVVGLVENDAPREFIAFAGAVGAVVTVVLLLRDSLDLYQRWSGAEIVYGGVRSSNAYFSGVQWSTGAERRPDRFDGRIDLGGARVSGVVERIWRDRDVDRLLWERAHAVPVELRETRYVLPDPLRGIAPRALRATNSRSKGVPRNKRPTWFNGRLCRLMTEPTVDQLQAGRLGVQVVTYYDGQVSNELWPWSSRRSGRDEQGFLTMLGIFFSGLRANFALRRRSGLDESDREQDGGKETRSVAHEYAVDASGRILGLSDARMANIVGITVFAITADEQVLFVRQTARNSVLPKGFVASASGSLDWADATREAREARARIGRRARADEAVGAVRARGLSGATSPLERDERLGEVNLRDLLFAGMLRELREESQVEPGDVIEGSQRVTGYFRWLARGAKPEFTGLVRLRVDLAELEKRTVVGEERNYTEGRAAVPLRLLREAAGSWTADQADLSGALSEGLGETVPIGASSIAAWCAAADFLAAHPEYLPER